MADKNKEDKNKEDKNKEFLKWLKSIPEPERKSRLQKMVSRSVLGGTSSRAALNKLQRRPVVKLRRLDGAIGMMNAAKFRNNESQLAETSEDSSSSESESVPEAIVEVSSIVNSDSLQCDPDVAPSTAVVENEPSISDVEQRLSTSSVEKEVSDTSVFVAVADSPRIEDEISVADAPHVSEIAVTAATTADAASTLEHVADVASLEGSTPSVGERVSLERKTESAVQKIQALVSKKFPEVLRSTALESEEEKHLSEIAQCICETEALLIRLNNGIRECESLNESSRYPKVLRALLESSVLVKEKIETLKRIMEKSGISQSLGPQFYPRLLKEINKKPTFELYSSMRLAVLFNLLQDFTNPSRDPYNTYYSFVAASLQSSVGIDVSKRSQNEELAQAVNKQNGKSSSNNSTSLASSRLSNQSVRRQPSETSNPKSLPQNKRSIPSSLPHSSARANSQAIVNRSTEAGFVAQSQTNVASNNFRNPQEVQCSVPSDLPMYVADESLPAKMCSSTQPMPLRKSSLTSPSVPSTPILQKSWYRAQEPLPNVTVSRNSDTLRQMLSQSTIASNSASNRGLPRMTANSIPQHLPSVQPQHALSPEVPAPMLTSLLGQPTSSHTVGVSSNLSAASQGQSTTSLAMMQNSVAASHSTHPVVTTQMSTVSHPHSGSQTQRQYYRPVGIHNQSNPGSVYRHPKTTEYSSVSQQSNHHISHPRLASYSASHMPYLVPVPPQTASAVNTPAQPPPMSGPYISESRVSTSFVPNAYVPQAKTQPTYYSIPQQHVRQQVPQQIPQQIVSTQQIVGSQQMVPAHQFQAQQVVPNHNFAVAQQVFPADNISSAQQVISMPQSVARHNNGFPQVTNVAQEQVWYQTQSHSMTSFSGAHQHATSFQGSYVLPPLSGNSQNVQSLAPSQVQHGGSFQQSAALSNQFQASGSMNTQCLSSFASTFAETATRLTHQQAPTGNSYMQSVPGRENVQPASVSKNYKRKTGVDTQIPNKRIATEQTTGGSSQYAGKLHAGSTRSPITQESLKCTSFNSGYVITNQMVPQEGETRASSRDSGIHTPEQDHDMAYNSFQIDVNRTNGNNENRPSVISGTFRYSTADPSFVLQ